MVHYASDMTVKCKSKVHIWWKKYLFTFEIPALFSEELDLFRVCASDVLTFCSRCALQLSRRRRRTGKVSWASRQSLHSLRQGDQCQEDQADDKHHRGINTEIKVNGQKLETVTSFKHLGCYNWWRFQAWDTLQDSTDNSSIDKVETSLEWQEYFSQFQDMTLHSLVTSTFLYACESWTSQQSCEEEYKPWKWRATARYYTSHTKTMLPTRKSVPRSSRQLDHTKTTWPL